MKSKDVNFIENSIKVSIDSNVLNFIENTLSKIGYSNDDINRIKKEIIEKLCIELFILRKLSLKKYGYFLYYENLTPLESNILNGIINKYIIVNSPLI